MRPRSSRLPMAAAFLVWHAASLLAAATPVAELPAPPFTGVHVDVAQLCHDPRSYGDSWDHIWAEDGSIYSFACDGSGYGTMSRNLNFSKLTGSTWDGLTGSLVNSMDEYGTPGQRWPNQANWKITGGDCIDGVFYAFISNHWYGDQDAWGGGMKEPHLRQTVGNMSLIRSTDHGRTWQRSVQDNYARPMWKDRRFSTAAFIKYGQNGGATTQDGQDAWVYAISNDGFWNCGEAFYLGRAPRARLAALDPGDWRYFSNGTWSARLADATPLAGFPTGQMACTMGSPIWLPGPRKYVTVTWYDPGTTVKWHYPENVTFAFYQADHPWGPWTYIGEKSVDDFMGDRSQRISRWYGPSLSPCFITGDRDGGATAILTFSGQTWGPEPESLYKNNCCPVTFTIAPQPLEVTVHNDDEAVYSPGWSRQEQRGVGDYHDDIHVTSTPGATADITFTGRGIELLCEKYHDMGDIELVLDGVGQGLVHLHQDPMPRLYQVEVFRRFGLADGAHTLRVINRAPAGIYCILDGFRTYGGDDFAADGAYLLVNRVTRKALAATGDGLREVPCPESRVAAAPTLRWRLARIQTGRYAIISGADGPCLAGAAQMGGAPRLAAAGDLGAFSSGWDVHQVGNGSFAISDAATGGALEGVEGAAGNVLRQQAYYARDVQKWEIIRVP